MLVKLSKRGTGRWNIVPSRLHVCIFECVSLFVCLLLLCVLLVQYACKQNISSISIRLKCHKPISLTGCKPLLLALSFDFSKERKKDALHDMSTRFELTRYHWITKLISP